VRRAEAQDSDLGLRHVHSHRFWFSPLFGGGCDPALPLLFVDGGDVKRNPAKQEGVSYEASAVQQILTVTERYPYFLQQWAHEAWNIAQGNSIRAKDVLEAHNNAISVLDESFFKVRFDRCTPSEKKYMRALAEFGTRSHRSGDIALLLKVKTASVAPTRSNLIKKGMIYSPSHGDTAFTVPLFDQYMKRAMNLK